MELQGIKILRISDLRRFFELDEFWRKRDEFIKMVGDPSKTFFFDNGNERDIYCLLREWMTKESEIPSIFQGDNTLIVKLATKDTSFSLGRMASEVSKYRRNIKNKDLIGLTLLYKLLGADREDSDIPLQYDFFTAIRTGKYVGEFIGLYENEEFESTAMPVFPLSRHVIVNMNQSRTISIGCGKQKIELQSGECVIGLFCNDYCYRLLPHYISDSNNGITLILKINKYTKKPRLEIHKQDGVRCVENVSSIAIENGGFPVYTTFDGELYCPPECFTLANEYDTFCNHNKDNLLLAFEISPEGGYYFYITNSILH